MKLRSPQPFFAPAPERWFPKNPPYEIWRYIYIYVFMYIYM
jgi:hypothetical protein